MRSDRWAWLTASYEWELGAAAREIAPPLIDTFVLALRLRGPNVRLQEDSVDALVASLGLDIHRFAMTDNTEA